MGGDAAVSESGEPAAGAHGRGEDVAAVARFFACLACEGDDGEPLHGDAAGRPASGDDDGPGTAYWQGVRAGRRVEQELVARLVAMAARRDRTPIAVGHDAELVTDAEYRRGLVEGRRIVHRALLVSRRMINGEACPVCGAAGVDGHGSACDYA